MVETPRHPRRLSPPGGGLLLPGARVRLLGAGRAGLHVAAADPLCRELVGRCAARPLRSKGEEDVPADVVGRAPARLEAPGAGVVVEDGEMVLRVAQPVSEREPPAAPPR